MLNVIDSFTKEFLEILSNVLVPQEGSLYFTYGRPDESCSSFTLMYFGKRRASQIKGMSGVPRIAHYLFNFFVLQCIRC